MGYTDGNDSLRRNRFPSAIFPYFTVGCAFPICRREFIAYIYQKLSRKSSTFCRALGIFQPPEINSDASTMLCGRRLCIGRVMWDRLYIATAAAVTIPSAAQPYSVVYRTESMTVAIQLDVCFAHKFAEIIAVAAGAIASRRHCRASHCDFRFRLLNRRRRRFSGVFDTRPRLTGPVTRRPISISDSHNESRFVYW